MTNRNACPNGKLIALISTRCASPISNSMELLFAPGLSFHNAHSKAATAAKSQSILAIANFEICIVRSEEHTSELQSLMRISYAVFCLKKKNKYLPDKTNKTQQ